MDHVITRHQPDLERVIDEYLEMPGLSLTPSQASRLFGIDTATCERILEELVDRRFLRRTAEGSYVRPSHA